MEFTTDKPVNISQLAYELGGISARWVRTDVTVSCVPLDGAELAVEQWDAAVAAHTPVDGWVHPDYVAAPSKAEQVASAIDAADTLDELKATLKELLV